MTPASQLKPELITLTQYEALPEDKRVEVFESIGITIRMRMVIVQHGL